MAERYFYHTVTERPMEPGQKIVFDETHRSGVYRRVLEKADSVREIYAHPDEYDAASLEHHTRVALRELAMEEVRVRDHPQYPSRLGCLYVSRTAEEAEKWAALFVQWGRPTYAIVRLRVTGEVFAGDAWNCFDAVTDRARNLRMAERYWKNLPNLRGETPITEILVSEGIEVTEIVKNIRANLTG